MIRVLYWIVLALAALALALFAASNRTPVALGFWPFGLALELPLYLAILLTFFAGLCCAARWRPGSAEGIGGARHASGGGASRRSKASWRQPRRGWPDRHCRPGPHPRRIPGASELVPPAIPPHAPADRPVWVPARG